MSHSPAFRTAACAAGTLLCLSLVAGCGIVPDQPRSLTADSFVEGGGTSAERGGSPHTGTSDNASPLHDSVHIELGPAADAPGSEPGRPISKTVRDAVRPPSAVVTQPSETTSQPTTSSGGQYADTTGVDQILGSVLAEVDGNPIYADKVLAILERPLAAEARKYPPDRFREVATDLIQRQLSEFIHADLEFAAAKRNLEQKDQDLVRQETVLWKQQQVAQAGGSVELARRKAREDGTDFEELAQQHFRLTMTQLYYQRRVIPQIQVSASDLRQYYESNREKEFTQPALVRFRIIRIDADKTGGASAAIDKIRHLQDRIKGGADFAEVAGQVNDDPALLKNHGDPQPGEWMTKGAFVSDKVDAAVWSLLPGEITPIIEDDGRYYLAKLEQRKGGTIQAFGDQTVQDKIREALRRQQFNLLRDKVRQELEKKAVIRMNPDIMQVTLEMVMQRYPRWVASPT